MNCLGAHGPGEAMLVLGYYFDFGLYECTEVMIWIPKLLFFLLLRNRLGRSGMFEALSYIILYCRFEL